MATTAAARSTEAQRILEAWNALADSERERLIPVLLHNTIGWQAFSVDDGSILDWLEDQFREANIPFRD
jgi:hypothetical protein